MTWIDGKSQLPVNETPPPQSGLMRFIRFPLTLIVIGIVLYIIAQIAAGMFRFALTREMDPTRLFQGNPLDLPYGIAAAGLSVLGYWLLKKIEGEPMVEFASWKWSRELSGGLIIGAGLMAIVTAFVWIMGHYRITGWGDAGLGGLAAMLGLAISSGVGEEILFRGVLFRLTEKLLGSWFALALSAGIFGFLHIGNANATWFSSLAIAVEAGILLGAIYMLTRRLWAAIGLHAAWNFVQGYVFGIPVSGHETPSLVTNSITGSDWMTGGAFGLEASVPALIVATAAGLAILRLAIQRGQLKHPIWVKEQAAEPLPPSANTPLI